MSAETITVLIVEDHFVVRAGLRAVIKKEPDMKVVAEAKNGADAITLHRAHRPDVTLMDLHLPGVDGMAAMRAILGERPEARVLVLSTYGAEEQLLGAMQAGARGYYMKHVEKRELLAAIRAIHAGERVWSPELSVQATEGLSRPELTPREREVLTLLGSGLANAGIAESLGISEGTVRVHVSHLLAKLGCAEKAQLVAEAFRRGIIKV
jgi:two-component system NarL family response regulator